MLRVGDHRALQAAVLAFKALGKTLQKDIRRATVQTMGPEWKQAVNERASSKMDQLIIAKGARIAGGNPPRAIAASSTRKLSGGLVPRENWQGWEFGSNGLRRTTYQRRNRNGIGTHRVTRDTVAQLPRRNAKGRIAFPAAAELGPRLASLFVQIVVRRVHEAAEGKR